jgi:hypothetical protein
VSKLLIVGGDRSGEHIKWFGRRVYINRKYYVQHRAHFKDKTTREYYVLEGMALAGMLDDDTLGRIEVCG